VIYLILFVALCPCLSANYLFIDRFVLDLSRPIRPSHFIKDRRMVENLTTFSDELIRKRNVFWIGNDWGGFAFGLNYPDGNYMFDSQVIPKNYRFDTPIPVEDTNKVRHLDLPGMKSFKPVVSKVLDEADYRFCVSASGLIRRIGFDNVKLYPECNVVQYQIRDFIGWDSGSYYIYFYSPEGRLPDEFKYKQKLNDNWYYYSRPRF
jgi:hypothetical protein